MAKILTWAKGQQYQWEREDFRKASVRLTCGGIMVAIFLCAGVALMVRQGVGGGTVAMASGFLFALLGACYASPIAIKWADKKLKS